MPWKTLCFLILGLPSLSWASGDGIRIVTLPSNTVHAYVALSTTSATTSASEQMQYFNQNVQGVRTQNLKQYVIPASSTLRLQFFSFSIRATLSTITWCRVTVRHSVSGGTSPNSYVIYTDAISTVGTVGGIANTRMPFADGIDIPGDGTADIGVSAVCTGAPLLDYALVGYQF